MQGKTQKDDVGIRKCSGTRPALLLGIVSGVALTLLCEGIWLASFVWYHHMFIFRVNGHGVALATVFIGLIVLGAVLLINAVRRIGV